MSLWSRIGNSLFTDRLNRELEAEIETHLEQMQADGVNRAAYGNVLRYAEESRDIRSVPWLDSLRADVVFGWRQLLRARTATVVAVLSLALGIGATTSVLRLFEAGFVRPLAIRDPGRLHFLRATATNVDGAATMRDSFSFAEMIALKQALREQATVLMVSFADRQDISWGEPTEVEKVSRQYVSGALFHDFDLRPSLGRVYGPAEDAEGADHRVALLSHDYWQRRFGGDPGVLGRTLQHGADRYTIVGVVEPSFTGTSTGAFTDLYLPLLSNTRATRDAPAAQWTWARILVHLKPHASRESVQEMIRAASRHHREEMIRSWPAGAPPAIIASYRDARIDLLPAVNGISNFHRDYLAPVAMLGATALLVLVLACTSVANLLTAQCASRAREMALRVSIGAGRMRLMQLLLTQSFLLASIASAVGLLFSWLATPLVVANLNPPDNPVRLHLMMDWRVMSLGVVLTFLVTVLFGLLPALQTSSLNPIEAIKGTGHARRQARLMRVLVALQVTFCFVVCFVASSMVTSLGRLQRQPLGFSPDRLLLVEMEVRGNGDPAPLWRTLRERAGELPGVLQAAVSGWPIQSGSANVTDAYFGERRRDLPRSYVVPVSPGWFSAMGIPLLGGRDFHHHEQEPTVVVNEQFARQYLDGGAPYGRQMMAGAVPHRIIGKVGDIRIRDVREIVRPTIYVPVDAMRSAVLSLRHDGNVAESGVEKPIRQWMAREFPQVHVTLVRSQMDLIRMQTVRERLLAAMSAFFAAVALALSGIGLYAVLSWTVSRRRREIAIRVALGARAGSVARAVLRESVPVLVAGCMAGLVLGLGAQRLIRALLFDVSSGDLAVLTSAAVALFVACALAAAAPLVRALRTDPARMLRVE